MYKVFNSQALTRNQRFLRSFVAGIVVTIGLSVVYGYLCRLIGISFSVAFIGMGWVIGTVIQRAGHGVQIQFSILGAILTLLCILFGEIISMGGISALFNLEYYLGWARALLSTNINSLIGVLFRIVGIYMGFTTSRIV